MNTERPAGYLPHLCPTCFSSLTVPRHTPTPHKGVVVRQGKCPTCHTLPHLHSEQVRQQLDSTIHRESSKAKRERRLMAAFAQQSRMCRIANGYFAPCYETICSIDRCATSIVTKNIKGLACDWPVSFGFGKPMGSYRPSSASRTKHERAHPFRFTDCDPLRTNGDLVDRGFLHNPLIILEKHPTTHAGYPRTVDRRHKRRSLNLTRPDFQNFGAFQ